MVVEAGDAFRNFPAAKLGQDQPGSGAAFAVNGSFCTTWSESSIANGAHEEEQYGTITEVLDNGNYAVSMDRIQDHLPRDHLHSSTSTITVKQQIIGYGVRPIEASCAESRSLFLRDVKQAVWTVAVGDIIRAEPF